MKNYLGPCLTCLIAAGITCNGSGQNLLVSAALGGSTITEITPGGAQSIFASGLTNPHGLAFDSAGDLFVAVYDQSTGIGNILRITPGGVQSIFASGLNGPYGLAFNSAGDLFEADEASGNIYEFTPGGVQSTFASGLNGPDQLAFNSAGDLFESDNGSGNIYEFTPGGVRSTFASGLGQPVGLAFDSAGNLFVANSSGTVYKFTPAGAQSTFASGLNGAGVLAFDSAGNLFVSGSGSGNIYKITPGGVASTFVSGLYFPWGLAFLPVAEPPPPHAGPGEVDLSFDPGVGVAGSLSGATTVDCVASQPDGKVLIGGNFSTVGGIRRTGIARLSSDGSLDLGFNPAPTNVIFGVVTSIALQPDGKILAIGPGALRGFPFPFSGPFFRRLNPDGSLDSAFAPTNFPGTPDALALQPDGKILIGGSSNFGLKGSPAIVRYNTNGTMDTSFNAGLSNILYVRTIVQAIVVQADGKVVIGGSFGGVQGLNLFDLVRLNPDGSLDSTFNPNLRTQAVQCLAIDTNGEIYAGGNFYDPTNVVDRFGLVRVHPDGSLDTAFNQNVRQLGPVTAISIQSDDKILANGVAVLTNGTDYLKVVRLNPDGTLDPAFDMNPGANGVISAIVTDADSRIFIGGAFTSVNGVMRAHIARLIGGDAPVITMQPQSQFVNQGDTVSFSVAATGNPPPTYQWLKNGTNALLDGGNISGATTATMSLTDVQLSDEGLYSAVVSNRVGSVLSSNALLRVNLLPVADASATQLIYISPNGINVMAILDGSRSYDPDGDALTFAWYEGGNLLAVGKVAVVQLPVGTNAISLVANDGMAAGTNTINVVVLTTSQAVEQLADFCFTNVTKPKPLLASLDAALAAIERGNSAAAINQLQAFENKVNAQIAPSDQALGETLLQSAQQIINALNGTQ
jgi:uncharacterized delta-60 repeat protein